MLKHKSDVEKYYEDGIKNERNGIIGLKDGIWKLREIRGGFQEGICPLC
jgi:hypothetical protein